MTAIHHAELGELFTEERSAEVVTAAFAATPDPRLREVVTSLVGHLHAFVKDVGLTGAEWATAIDFLTRTGQTCTDTRQEFILLSDVLGVSMLVETLNHRADGTTTEATVEGPFHVVTSPERPLGADLNIAGEVGEACVVLGAVTDDTGKPVPGAQVDIWQANASGFYDVQRPDEMGVGDLRGRFTTDTEGGFWFRSIVPSHYPIPADGPVGALLRDTGRHEFRPAHVHFEVSAPGMRTVTTHVFVAGSPYLDSDTVFGVKESLVRDFAPVDATTAAEVYGIRAPLRMARFDIVLQRLPPQ